MPFFPRSLYSSKHIAAGAGFMAPHLPLKHEPFIISFIQFTRFVLNPDILCLQHNCSFSYFSYVISVRERED